MGRRPARQYLAVIYWLDMRGKPWLVVVSGHELVNEVCDETRFHKNRRRRCATSRRCRTACSPWTHEPNWHKAHNILLPNFSQQAMQGYSR